VPKIRIAPNGSSPSCNLASCRKLISCLKHVPIWSSGVRKWNRTKWKLFDEPKFLIQSIDEPYSAVAKAAAENRSLDLAQKQLDEATAQHKAEQAQQGSTKQSSKSTSSLPAPRKSSVATTNQHGTTTNRRRSSVSPAAINIRDNFLIEPFNEFKLHAISINNSFDLDWLSQIGRSISSRMSADLLSSMRRSFIAGYISLVPDEMKVGIAIANKQDDLLRRSTIFVDRIINSIIAALRRRKVDTLNSSDRMIAINAVFDSLKFRIDFVFDVEIRKARNFGKVLALRDSRIKEVSIATFDTVCDKCRSHSKEVIRFENKMVCHPEIAKELRRQIQAAI